MVARILILDEDPAMCQLYQATFHDAGYSCMVAATLPAIATVSELQPDLILLNYFHGTPPDGWIFLIQLNAYRETEAIPVLLCTTHQAAVAAHAHDLAAFNVTVVFQPFDLDDLLAAVRYSLLNAQATGQN